MSQRTDDRDCGIRPDHYERILRGALEAGHRVCSLAEYYAERCDPTLILRHDVDVSLELAADMAAIEERVGVHSTYFIRVHAAGYNVYSRRGSAILSGLVNSGFDVGLHHEVGTFPARTELPRHQLRDELRVLEIALGMPVRSVATHLPKHVRDGLDKADLAANRVLYDGGDPVFNEGAVFVSDSNRRLRPECPCRLLPGSRKIFAVLHPVWWMSPDADAQALRAALVRGE